jgi:hypothetical protein
VTETRVVAEFRAALETATGVGGPYTTWGFGDDAEPVTTELGLLVRDG